MNRENTINIINKSLNNKKISKQIEENIYKYSLEYINMHNMDNFLEEIYINKTDDILGYLNLNSYLINSIKENKINPSEIPYLKPEELSPQLYEHIIKKRELEEYKKNHITGSSVFTCSKCNKANCSVTQKQLRSADEPPTTIVKCLECNHIFKFN